LFALYNARTEKLPGNIIWPFLLLRDEPAHALLRGPAGSERRTLKV
jgi:hypothetical protein